MNATFMPSSGRRRVAPCAVAAVASDGMGWVTGQRIEAYGGMRL